MWTVTLDGVQIALNVEGSENRAEAVQALAALLEAARMKGVPPSEARGPTVQAAVAQFLAQQAHALKPSTVTGYAWFLTQLAGAVGPGTALAALSAAQVEKSALRGSWSQSTRHDYLGAVGTFLRAAGHPLRLRRPPKESRGAAAVWTEAEWFQVLGAARGDFKPLLHVLRETGCRPSEAAGLTCEGVDWGAGHAILRTHKNAGKGKPRVLVFPDVLMPVLALQRRQYGVGPLFLNEEGRAFTGLSLSRRMALARERAGVSRPLTLYGLRHTYATRALAAGASGAQVGALLGNSESMVTRHYGHLGSDAKVLRELAERVAGKAG